MPQLRTTLVRLIVGICMVLALPASALAQLVEQGSGKDASVQTAHLRAELIQGSSNYTPEVNGALALVLHLEPGWHVCWLQAGDSGEPPSVNWVLPPGVHLGTMEFPAPVRLPLGPLMDYGYEGTAVFPLGARHYVLLRADWTRYEPTITQQLAEIDRSGVPTYVIYPGQTGAAPQVLPEFLTKGVVLKALADPHS